MKITIFGLTISSSWGNGHATPYRALIRALHRRGARVSFYEKDLPYYASRRDFDRCDYCELVFYERWEDVQSRALRQAAESDVVMVASYCPGGAIISDQVLDLGQPLHVFYDLDAPITLKNLALGDVEYLRRDQIPQFDLYLSFTGGPLLEELETVWKARLARPLYGCVDPDLYFPVEKKPDYGCRLSYMGTYSPDRQQRLDQFFLEPARRLPQSAFVLAGSLFPWNWAWPQNVRRIEHVPPAEHPSLYCSSQATLNITRGNMARNGYCPSGRFFEAAACGTPVLSDYWQGLETFFRDGEEIFVVRSADDVVALLNFGHDLGQAATRARERTLSEHTGERRAQQLLGFLEAALHDRRACPVEAAP